MHETHPNQMFVLTLVILFKRKSKRVFTYRITQVYDCGVLYMCVWLLVPLLQSVMPSSQDDLTKDKPRPLSSISRQQRSKTHITRTASGGCRSLNTHRQADTALKLPVWMLEMFTLFKGGGDFGGAGSSRSISDQDQDFEREVKTSIIYLNDLPCQICFYFIRPTFWDAWWMVKGALRCFWPLTEFSCVLILWSVRTAPVLTVKPATAGD